MSTGYRFSENVEVKTFLSTVKKCKLSVNPKRKDQGDNELCITDGTFIVKHHNVFHDYVCLYTWKDVGGVLHTIDSGGGSHSAGERYQKLYKKALKRMVDKEFEKIVLKG